MKILVIVPTYNESGNIEKLVHQVFVFLPQTEVLIIDDNSADGTGRIADRLAASNPSIHVIHRPKKWVWEMPIIRVSDIPSIMDMILYFRWTQIFHISRQIYRDYSTR